MIIKTKGFTIRPWKTGDEKYLVEAANNPKISRNMIDSFSQSCHEMDKEGE